MEFETSVKDFVSTVDIVDEIFDDSLGDDGEDVDSKEPGIFFTGEHFPFDKLSDGGGGGDDDGVLESCGGDF